MVPLGAEGNAIVVRVCKNDFYSSHFLPFSESHVHSHFHPFQRQHYSRSDFPPTVMLISITMYFLRWPKSINVELI